MPPLEQDFATATLGITADADADAVSEDPASILIAHSLEVSHAAYTAPNNGSTNAASDGSASVNTEATHSLASSRATPLQQTAMEEYIESPSPEKWQVLVQTMADEKRRLKSSSSSSSSRRNNHSPRRSAAPYGVDDRSHDNDDPLLFSSVEIPNIPRSTSRGALAVIKEYSDDTLTMPSTQTAAAECEELELIAALDEEGFYEEGDTEAEELEDTIDRTVPFNISHAENEEIDADVINSDIQVHEGDYKSSLNKSQTAADYCEMEDVEEDDVLILTDIEEGNTLVPTSQTPAENEGASDSIYRAVQFVAYNNEDENATEEIEIIVESETPEDEEIVAPVPVEDIIADLNALMGINSSVEVQQQPLITHPLVSSESSSTNGVAPIYVRESRSDGVWDKRPNATINQTVMAVPPKNNHAGTSTSSVDMADEAKSRNVSSGPVHDNDVAIQNEKDHTLTKHRWKQYIVWGLLFCLAIVFTVWISLSSIGNSKNSENNSSLRVDLPSCPPSTFHAPSGSPSSHPSIPPSTSPPPSTFLSSLPWQQFGQAAVGEATDDWMGWSTTLSSDGMTMAVGTPGSFNLDDRPGYVKVYRRDIDGSIWEQLGSNMEGVNDGDLFGQSLALSSDGKFLAIGAPGYFERRDRPGYVQVYYLEKDIGADSLRWTQLGQDILGEYDGDMSGISVALSTDGVVLAVGANGNNSGRVRVYRRDGTRFGSSWKKLGQDIEGEAVNDNSGKSIDLSADGKILAIGAPFNSGNNGKQLGHVRVYHIDMNKDGPSWMQLGQDIDGEAAGDWSGRSVSLAADGNILAIGANGNDGNGNSAGHVKVYRLEEDYVDDLIWKRLGQDIDGEAAGDQSGVQLALSADGTTLAIGANGNDGNGISSGHVQVYYREDNTMGSGWKRLGHGIDGEAAGDNSGFSVSLSADGKTVAIGSPWYSKTNGDKTGQVKVFDIEY
eukprot:CAMPEP_0201665014 /NCGR_PEP_ID=MMETSP0494-20130426/6303_1 /ASSEMBLY_ACC=CAM_ASM_000839 /TAXON_ID=420259 /ORGANISM="Thalassiosira gravida, Strain GMp14c1" /LENGTH=950 /DNA_ID=CAMNT_0048143895 /DNA_START=339 /DNA_END=3191 /DNA_ORIENTATION=+